MTNTLDLTTDMIDVRDIIERLEELESDIDSQCTASAYGLEKEAELKAELKTLVNIMQEMAGYGGDEQWRGDWYPVTLINEGYFVEYIKELIHDCYEMPKEMHSGNWPYRHMTIDYDAAADEAKADYSEIEIEGATYFYR